MKIRQQDLMKIRVQDCSENWCSSLLALTAHMQCVVLRHHVCVAELHARWLIGVSAGFRSHLVGKTRRKKIDSVRSPKHA